MSYPGSPPPPPWANITGISRTVMKDNAQETLSNYDGNARPGEIVADLTQDPPTLYIGNNAGQLTLIGGGGGYGNTQVGQYLAAGLVGNIVPSGNGTYSLGNSTNWWSNVWITGNTLYIGGVPVGMSGNTLTVNGNPIAGLPLANGTSNVDIATANGNVTVTTDGTYNWTFDDTGNLTLPSGGILYSQGSTPSGAPGNTIILQPSGTGTITNQKLMLYPTAGDGDHLHMVTGNLYETELFLGSDNFYIKLANTGNAVINTNDDNGNTAQWTFGADGRLTFPGTPRIDTDENNFEVQAAESISLEANAVVNIYTDTSGSAYQWQFGDDGNLTLPQGMVISGNVNFLGTDTALLNPADNTPLSLFSSGANGTITSFWAEDIGNLMSSNIAAIYTPLQGTQTVRIVNGTNGGNIAIYDFDNAGTFSTTSVSAAGNITGNYFIGDGSQLSNVNAVTVDVTDTNGLTTIYYPTFVENRTTAQIARADVDLTYRTDENLLTVGNVSASGNVTGNYFIGNGSQLTDVAASVPSQTILPTIQTITVEARPAGLFGGGQGGANVTVANVIPVTEYGVIITDGTVSEKYKTGSLGSIPGTVSLTFTTGLNSAQFTVFAYVTSNAGTFYSNSAIGTSGICLLAGTQIALSDGSYKSIEDITYTDKMLSWDFDRGCYAETTAMWIKRGETGSQYNLLSFSDGTTLRTFDQHRIFNKQAGAFTYPMTDATPVGTVTVNEHGQEITLTNKQVIVDTIEYYNVITDYHMNLFSNSVLTSCRFNNIYPIQDMKFVKDSRPLRSRSEFHHIDDRFFHGLRLAEQQFDLGMIEWYVARLESSEITVGSAATV
jgi:hypothetical protein